MHPESGAAPEGVSLVLSSRSSTGLSVVKAENVSPSRWPFILPRSKENVLLSFLFSAALELSYTFQLGHSMVLLMTLSLRG